MENELSDDLKVLQYLKSLNTNEFVEIGEFLKSIGVDDYKRRKEILNGLSKDEFIEYTYTDYLLPQMDIEYLKLWESVVKENISTKNSPNLESSEKLTAKILERGKKYLIKELNEMSKNDKSTNIIISGNVTNSSIVQDSDLRDIDVGINTEATPRKKQKTPQSKSSGIVKVINLIFKHPIISGLIVGIILLAISWVIKNRYGIKL